MALVTAVRGNPVAWENFYKTARWQRLRKRQLEAEPLCQFCLERGIVTAANVVDHVVPHKGDWTAFVTGELQNLCEPCHKSLNGKSSCAAIAATSASTAFRPILTARSTVHAAGQRAIAAR
jgi:hypothetical protein